MEYKWQIIDYFCLFINTKTNYCLNHKIMPLYFKFILSVKVKYTTLILNAWANNAFNYNVVRFIYFKTLTMRQYDNFKINRRYTL